MEGILYLKRTLLLSDKLLLSGLRDPFSHTRLGRNHLDRRSVMPANFADELKKYGLVVMVFFQPPSAVRTVSLSEGISETEIQSKLDAIDKSYKPIGVIRFAKDLAQSELEVFPGVHPDNQKTALAILQEESNRIAHLLEEELRKRRPQV